MKTVLFSTISIALHIFLVMLGLLSFSSIKESVMINIPVQLYSQQSNKNIISKPSLTPNKNNNNKSKSPQPQKIASRSKPNKNTNQLLLKLHNAIGAMEDYPETIALNHSTSVTIKMSVSPNGELTNLKIAKSSGNVLLDNTVLQAAAKASPVKDIQGYLFQKRVFSVDIIFG